MIDAQLIKDGVVVNVIKAPIGSSLSGDGKTLLLPDGGEVAAPDGSHWVIHPEAGIGWGHDNGELIPPVENHELSANALKTYSAAKADALLLTARSYSTDGVTIKSNAIPATLADLAALAKWGEANPDGVKSWVADDLTVTSATGRQFVALSLAVAAYAQDVYEALAWMIHVIDAAAVTGPRDVDAYSWPA